MPKRASKVSESLKQLADIQVNEWDFMGLLQTDIQDLEIGRSLRRFGNIKVIDWDYGAVLPEVKKAVDQEVNLVRLFHRAASCKVMDWDFRSVLSSNSPLASSDFDRCEKKQSLILRLKNFLNFVVANLIDRPDQAQIKVSEMGPTGLRFKLVLMKKDVAIVIGREGYTAAALRNIIKAHAEKNGVQALLQIHSHEEEAAFLAKKEGGK